mmetsp:Transcript_14907/g.41892  ORF Transcript_14907/g.41892 Transcript_14907/m.41892 type:complete len:143 (+) Transcript_14907:478-906(+)
MGFLQAEDVLLPARFLTLTSHLVVTLCIVLDLDRTAARISTPSESPEDVLRVLEPLAYTALGSLLFEVIGLFTGATIFQRGLSCIYIVLHFIGTILVGLLIEQYWSLDAYIVIFTVFNALPCVLEMMFGTFYLRGRLMEYRK